MPEYLIRLEASNDTVLTTSGAQGAVSSKPREIARADLLSLANQWSRLRRAHQDSLPSEDAVVEIADQLTSLMLGPHEALSLQDALRAAIQAKKPLHLIFELYDPAFFALPLELLRLPQAVRQGQGTSYYALHPSVSLERRVNGARRHVALPEDPTRILVIMSNPGTQAAPHLPGLLSEGRVLHALLERIKSKSLQYKIVQDPTLATLEREVHEFKPTAVHLSGHFIPSRGGVGYVVSGEKPNTTDTIVAEDLRRILRTAGTSLCILNGCRNSGLSSGLAETLADTGEISVVGHQFEIMDDDSTDFADSFYSALVNGAPVTEAVSGVRRRMSSKGTAWLLPVYYGHAPMMRIAPDRLAQSIEKRSSIVGRREVSEQIVHALLYGDEPIVQLWGGQGFGKSAVLGWVSTVLSLYLGIRIDFVDCSVEGLTQFEQVLAEVLVPDTGLEEKIEVRRVVLLDHFAVKGNSKDLLDKVSEGALRAGIRVVVARREPLSELRVQKVKIGPLRLAVHDEDIEESTRLFLDGWQGEPDSVTIELINQICRKLQGHPGLIKLAASLANLNSIQDIAKKIEESPESLIGDLDDLSGLEPSVLQGLPEDLQFVLECCGLFQNDFSDTDVARVSGLDTAKVSGALQKLANAGLLLAPDETRRGYSLIAMARAALQKRTANSEYYPGIIQRYVELQLEAGRTIVESFKGGSWKEASEAMRHRNADFASACKYLVEARNDEGILEAFSLFGLTFFESDIWNYFDIIAEPALESARRMGSKDVEVRALGLLGAQHAVQKNYDKCIEYWTLRAQIAHEIKDYVREADSLLDIGWQLHEVGNPNARQYVERGRKVAIQGRSRIMLATAYAILGNLAAEDGDEALTAKCVRKCCRLAERLKDEAAIIFLYSKVAYAASKIDDLWSAVSAYRRAIELCRFGSKPLQLVEVLFRTSLLLFNQNNLISALHATELARRYRTERGLTYDQDTEWHFNEIVKGMTASGVDPTPHLRLPTNEIYRRLMRELDNFVKNFPPK